jgi:hypothetical protein
MPDATWQMEAVFVFCATVARAQREQHDPENTFIINIL